MAETTFTPSAGGHIHLLQKELSYYRRFTTHLAKELQRTQETLELANREVRRYQVQQRLGRELSLVAATAANLTALCRRVADAVIEHALCARVAVMAEQKPGCQVFDLVAAVGGDLASLPGQIRLQSVPDFGFACTGRDHPSEAAETLRALGDYIGHKHIIWDYDAETGFALLMANVPGPALLEFQADDEDLTNVALEGLLDGVWRLRSRLRRNPEPVPAPPPSVQGETTPLIIDGQMATIQETEITSGLQRGQPIRDIAIIEWMTGEFILFVAPSQSSGFRLLRKFRDQGNRKFKDMMSVLRFVRTVCAYQRHFTIYLHDDPEVKALVSCALSADERTASGEEAA